jgi:hypothetical protein
MSIDLDGVYEDDKSLVLKQDNPDEQTDPITDNREILMVGNLSDSVYKELNTMFALEHITMRVHQLNSLESGSDSVITPEYVFATSEELLKDLNTLVDSFNTIVSINKSGKLTAIYMPTSNATKGVALLSNYATENNIPIYYSAESLKNGVVRNAN